MNDKQDFVPALGRAELTADYDRVIAVMTRERRWRAALLDLIAPEAGDAIVDVGAGTGSQAIAIKRRAPGARVIGLGPDPQILALARDKAKAAGVDIEWVEGLGDRAAQILGHGVATKIVSSLVLHQCDLDVTAAILHDTGAAPRRVVDDRRLRSAENALDEAALPPGAGAGRLGAHRPQRQGVSATTDRRGGVLLRGGGSCDPDPDGIDLALPRETRMKAMRRRQAPRPALA